MQWNINGTSSEQRKTERKNPISKFFFGEKKKKSVKADKRSSLDETDKENDDDLFDILTRVQGSRFVF